MKALLAPKIFQTISMALFVGAFAFVAIAAFPNAAHAETSGVGGRPANPDPNNARSKSIFIKTITPGTQVADAVEVINNTDSAKTIQVYGADAVNSSGGAFACAQAADTALQVGKWIALEKTSVDVLAGERVVIPFTITAPADAEPGEKNGCIVLQEKTGAVIQSGIGLSFRTAIRVAILVPGDIKKVLTPLGITTSTNTKKAIITPRVENTGNVSLDADVTASLRSLFGMTIGSQTNDYPILRDQISEWNFEVERPFWGGFYQASYDLSYDASNNFIGSNEPQDLKIIHGQSAWLFVLPHVGALIIYLVIIAAIVAGIVRLHLYRQHRAYVKAWKDYAVTDADNLQTLAKFYSVNWKTLAKENSLKAPYILNAGQIIKVPTTRKRPAKRRSPRKK